MKNLSQSEALLGDQSHIFERRNLYLNKKSVTLPTLLYSMKRLDWLLLAVAVCTIAGVYAINFLR